jgi:hypothetical protein
LNGIQDRRDPFRDEWRPVGILEGRARPVVDDLHDRESLVDTPDDFAMGPGWIVRGAENGDVMGRGQRATELERVDLGSRLVAGQKVVDRVKNTQVRIIASAADPRRPAPGNG